MITNKKILFILPKSDDKTKADKIPLGVLYLCTALDRHGYDSEIMDLSIDDVDYLDFIEKEEIRFVGISFVTCNRFDAFDMCNKIKQRFPDITIIAGGAHVTSTYMDTLTHIKSIDIIVIGEGELTIVGLMDALQKNDVRYVKGIAYRDINDNVKVNEKREFIQDLDILGLDRSFVSLSDYGQVLPYDKEKTLATSINCIRGCWYACTYCSTSHNWGRKVRYRSVKNIVDEIEDIIEHYGIYGFDIVDDNFTHSKEKVLEFCEEIRIRNLKIKWCCESRVNTIDEDMVIEMKNAGCYLICVAIESANPQTLVHIRKSITIEQATKVVKMITGHGIKLKCFFIFGLPDDGKKEIENTANYLLDIQHLYKVQPIYSILTIFPGTQLEKEAKEKGILSENFSWCDKIISPKRKYNLYFAEQVPLFSDGMPYEKLCDTVRMAFIKYYARHPFRFVKVLFKNLRHVGKWV